VSQCFERRLELSGVDPSVDLDTLYDRAKNAWAEGRDLTEIHPLDLARMVFALRERQRELEEAKAEIDRVKLACHLQWSDLERIASLCGRTADEYPLKAVERVVRQLDEARADVERARREGAEAMRGAAAQACRPMLRDMASRSTLAREIRALSLPGDEK
jgi:hypothetical protein